MKKIFTTAVLIIVSISVYSQLPCSWFSNPTPDSITIDSVRKTFNVPKLRADQSISIDGLIDNTWLDFGFDTLSQVVITQSGQTLQGKASWCYDVKNFYIIVQISGDDTIETNGPNYDQLQLCYQRVFGGDGDIADHNNEADWRKWLWKKDGDLKWWMPVDKTLSRYIWLDLDVDNNGIGPDCADGNEGDEWFPMEFLEMVKFNSTVTGDTIIYEMYFNWKNFLSMDDSPPMGYEFGFEISYKDYEDNGKNAQINLNDPGNNAWAYAPAMGKFITGDTLTPALGIREMKKYSLEIYPNPTSNKINVNIPQGNNYTLSAIDITGRKVEQIKIPTNTSKYVIDAQNYSKGVYNIILNNKDNIYHSKVIVQ